MDKLKTLKDITKGVKGFWVSGQPIKDRFILDTELRAEAIKWYKWAKEEEDKTCPECWEEILYASGFMKHFFNITKEELK